MARVLLADDDAMLRFTIGAAIKRHHHTVVEVVDGDSCLRAVTRERFDLVCMDAHMPGASIDQRIRQIHALRPLGPRLVVLTGLAEPRLAALLEGEDELLQKPVTLANVDRILDPLTRTNC